MNTVKMVGERLRTLREDAKYSQAVMSQKMGLSQSTLNRYENNQSEAPYGVLLQYADTFNVSLDYIFGRTENPHGKYFVYDPQSAREKLADQGEFHEFVSACFEEGSPMNRRLKNMMLELLADVEKGEKK